MDTTDSVKPAKVKKDKKEKKDKKDKKEKKEKKIKSVVPTEQDTEVANGITAPTETITTNSNGHADERADAFAAGNQSTELSEKKKAKKEKKEKKRKQREEEEEGDVAQAAPSVPETTLAEAETSAVNGEDGEKKKKKRKKNVKGAFGNQAKADAEGEASATTDSKLEKEPTASTSTSNVSAPSPSQISEFITTSELTYEPADSASSYPPILSFNALPIKQSIKDGLGSRFPKPTIVQSASWGVQLKVDKQTREKDCIAIASTGSGKTLAFGIPVLQHILALPSSVSKSVVALIVAPTRELAMQTHVNLAEVSDSLNIGVTCIYGGAPKWEQKQALSQHPRIVVGTPGRIIDFMEEGTLDLSNVGWLVLDEADRMLDKGFENEIRKMVDRCLPSNASKKGRITSMFSATWPMSVRRLASDFMIDPIRITVGSDELAASATVSQKIMVLQDGRQKDHKLLDVLRAEGYSPRGGGGGNGKARVTSGSQREKVLVFALYKKEAARVAQWLERQGYQVGCIQGDLSQAARTQALEDFRNGVTGVLVATDVAARGLDIPKVELVLNYTFPLTVEDYVHRIGRTGRAGRPGQSITFFTELDKAHSGELQRVLKDANQEVPEDLAAFGGTIKKKSHAAYGDHFKDVDMTVKPKKITF